MSLEKMQEVFSDEAFVKSLFAMDTAAEVQAVLQEKGVELTEEDILSIRELLGKVESGELTPEQLELWQKQAENGELSEDVLEQVAGGGAFAAMGIIAGLLIGASGIVGIKKRGFKGFFKNLASFF